MSIYHKPKETTIQERVILILKGRYRGVWPPGVVTVMVPVLNTLLQHCYIVTKFY